MSQRELVIRALCVAALSAILAILLGFAKDAVLRDGQATTATWRSGTAVGYWTKTWLTGCYARGRCRMACGGLLNDHALTVASNPQLGLPCGARIRVCYRRCATARVTDRTASTFAFEFTYALSLRVGTRGWWAAPRSVRWRRLG